MTRTLRSAGLGVALAVIAAAGLTAQSGQHARDLFERARLAEENSRTLGRAVELYAQVVTQAETDRALAAEAQLRLAMVLERQGKPEAREAFTKVVRDFGDQPGAAIARARVAPATAEPRRLVEDPRFFAGDISPDGRLAVGTQAPGGLVVKELGSGATRALDPGPGVMRYVTVSGDGSRVAYLHLDSAKPILQIRVVATAPGGAIRAVLERPAFASATGQVPRPYAWSRDGGSVLIGLQTATGAPALGWLSADTNDLRIIKTFAPGTIVDDASLSSDGNWVAYMVADRIPPSTTRIQVIDKNGGPETDVVALAGINRNPVWSADGARLFFNSNRSGPRALWSVGMAGGRSTDNPAVVRTPFDGSVLQISAAGEMYYVQEQFPSQHVYVAERGIPGARGLQGFNGEGVSWSPDGESLAFIKQNPSGRGPALVVRHLSTGNERLFEHPNGLGLAQVRWSANGALLYAAVSKLGAHLLDLASQRFTAVAPTTAQGMFRGNVAALSADGRTLYAPVRRAGNAGGVTPPWEAIVAVNVATGEEQSVVALAEGLSSVSALGIAVSPDGAQLVIQAPADALGTQARLILVNTDGSGRRDLYGPFPVGAIASTVAWTPDGQHVLFAMINPATRAWRLMRMSMSGGEPVFDGLESAALAGDASLPALSATSPVPLSLTVSPDGSRRRLWRHGRRQSGVVGSVDPAVAGSHVISGRAAVSRRAPALRCSQPIDLCSSVLLSSAWCFTPLSSATRSRRSIGGSATTRRTAGTCHGGFHDSRRGRRLTRDLAQTVEDAGQFLVRGSGKALTDAVDGQRANLTNLDPRAFGEACCLALER